METARISIPNEGEDMFKMWVKTRCTHTATLVFVYSCEHRRCGGCGYATNEHVERPFGSHMEGETGRAGCMGI